MPFWLERRLSLMAVTWHFLCCVVVSPHPCWSSSSSHRFILWTKPPYRRCSIRCSVSVPSLCIAFSGCTWVCRRIASPLEKSLQCVSVHPDGVSQMGSSKPCPGGALLIVLFVPAGSRRARPAPKERSVAMPMARTS